MTKCREITCPEAACFTVHWPGEDIESCATHAAGWAQVAVTLGLKVSIEVHNVANVVVVAGGTRGE